MNPKRLICAISLGFCVATIIPLSAQTFQLTVDESNPAAVVIQSTGQFAQNADAVTLDSTGISLLSFFTSPGLFTVAPTSSTLQAPTGRAYSLLNGDDTNPLTQNLRIANSAIPGQAQGFSTSLAAFQGSLLVDFSSQTSRLPAVGTTGQIIASWSGSPGVVLGQWVVVPEPETYGLAVGASLVAFALWRRRER